LWRPRDKYRQIAIFDPKKKKKNLAVLFLPIFGHQNPGSGTGSGFTKNAGPVPGSVFNDPDPQHCLSAIFAVIKD
jgi:hypothetical protein